MSPLQWPAENLQVEIAPPYSEIILASAPTWVLACPVHPVVPRQGVMDEATGVSSEREHWWEEGWSWRSTGRLLPSHCVHHPSGPAAGFVSSMHPDSLHCSAPSPSTRVPAGATELFAAPSCPLESVLNPAARGTS